MKITPCRHRAQCLRAPDLGAAPRGWRVDLAANVARIAFARRRPVPGLPAMPRVFAGIPRSGIGRRPLPRWRADAPRWTCVRPDTASGRGAGAPGAGR